MLIDRLHLIAGKCFEPKGPECKPKISIIPNMGILSYTEEGGVVSEKPNIFCLLYDQSGTDRIVGFRIYRMPEVLRSLLSIRWAIGFRQDSSPLALGEILTITQTICTSRLNCPIPDEVIASVRALPGMDKACLTPEQYRQFLVLGDA